MTDFALRMAQAKPTEAALQDARSTIDWMGIYETLNRLSNGLQEFSLGDDRRIAVFAENSIETALANLGGLVAGASVVPVNFHLTAPEVVYILNDSGARVLFAGPETIERALEAAAMSCVERIIAWRCEQRDALDWQTWLAASSQSPAPLDIPPRPNLLYTSGTTGRPKGTELPPTMFAGGETIAEHLEQLALNPLADSTLKTPWPLLSEARSRPR